MDAGTAWQTARRDAHKCELGDKGSILGVMDEEDGADNVRHSLELGKSWYVHLPRLPYEMLTFPEG